MPYIDMIAMLGYTNNAYMMMEAFRSSSNVVLTDNPEYTLCMFRKTFPIIPVGEGEQEVPEAVFNLFKAMADKAIKKDRYFSAWEYLMGLYIAHMSILYLKANQGDPSSLAAIQSSVPSGVATSKSVDGLSISYDLLGTAEDFAGYGTWKLTTYGQQLITLTKMYGHSGMWVNG